MHHIVKLPNGNYLVWSSVADAPLSRGLSADAFVDLVREEYGHVFDDTSLETKMALADSFGSSRPGYETLDELIEDNCAGPDGSSLTLDEIVELYGGDSGHNTMLPTA